VSNTNCITVSHHVGPHSPNLGATLLFYSPFFSMCPLKQQQGYGSHTSLSFCTLKRCYCFRVQKKANCDRILQTAGKIGIWATA
jgi:hypothetical protein